MLKLLAIILLVVFLLRGLGSLIRLFLGGTSPRPDQQFERSRSRRARGGNVNIDYEPKQKRRKSGRFSGGEYVDYEDID